MEPHGGDFLCGAGIDCDSLHRTHTPSDNDVRGRMSFRESDRVAHSTRRSAYSEVDQRTWRQLVLRTREALSTFRRRVHPACVRGFQTFFGDCRAIPPLPGIDARLGVLGWRTVNVGGYLPSQSYANLLANRILPIVGKIRHPRDIAHSPAPDLAHDLLGHLPMMLDEELRRFLERLGQALKRAQSDARDEHLFLAQRRLSALREQESPAEAELEAAEHALQQARRDLEHEPSVLARLNRLYLWTIEFGLLGTVDDWAAYGAGLISSPAELRQLMSGDVEIRPLGPEALARDIEFCDPQPCYYAAKDYAELNRALDALNAESEASPSGNMYT